MIIITGKKGQLAMELQTLLNKNHIDYIAYEKSLLDITNEEQINSILGQIKKPTILVNCAAYNQVDLAEDDGKELAYSVNAHGVENLANFCKKNKIFLIHISTDYVFGENPQNTFLTVSSKTNPFSEYGKSKRDGELALQNITNLSYSIIRTSWVFSKHKNNFLKTIIRLASDTNRTSLSIIEDQIGRPTSAIDLANFIHYLCKKINNNEKIENIYQFSNNGIASWYDFAHEIIKQGIKHSLIKNKDIKLIPITSKEYPQKAQRPKYSVMDLSLAKKEVLIPHWKERVKDVILQLKND